MTAALRVVLVWALLTLTTLLTAGAAAAHVSADPTGPGVVRSLASESLEAAAAGVDSAGSTAASTEPEPDIPPWVFAVGAIAAVAVVAYRTTRRRP